MDLPTLASGMADEIINSIEFDQISDIAIVGKVALASQNSTFAEADIILKSENNFYPISLKLSKANAFVNTKSAGLRSFFTKYFSSFGDETVNSIQGSFNQNCDLTINNFANALYANHDLEYDGSFAQWVDLGNTSLSGQLEGADRELYKHMLYAINEKVYIHVNQLLVKDPKAFSMDLLPLMGFGDRQIIQATCFYKASAKNYAAFDNVVEVYDSGFEKLVPKLGSFKRDVANFDICLGKKTLQLRVKAMNKFTSKSFKMNCSVKTS
jgi:hypothetical protein